MNVSEFCAADFLILQTHQQSTRQHTAQNRLHKMCPIGQLYISRENKKLSCRRETVRRFVSLNILLSHSTSPKVIRNDTVK